MFKKYMDLAKINKIIAKQRKLAKSSPNSGYSAVLSGLLENEAKGTFKSYPEYTRKVINNFFVESVQSYRQTDAFRQSCEAEGNDPLTVNNNTVIFVAVLTQAIICKDLTEQEAEQYAIDNNLIKVLVNMKLLPERCLNDCEFDMRVA